MITFPTFFKLVHGYQPYNYQKKLADLLLDNDWSQSLVLPPNSGKTAFITCWFYSLLQNVLSGKDRIIPLRLFFCVNRRIIVDEAYYTAVKIEKALGQEALAELVEAMKSALSAPTALKVARLRGGLDFHTKNEWLAGLTTPTFISCTLDQYGSRLFFSGYGVSPRSRSVHAALTANDALLVLDEAHLAWNFARNSKYSFSTIKKIGNVPISRTVELTATAHDDSKSFPVTIEEDPRLVEINNVKRHATIIEKKKTEFIDTMIEQAKELMAKEGVKVVAVLCNTVANARKIANRLKKSVLLIGPCREHEKKRIGRTTLARGRDIYGKIRLGRDRSKDEPLFVVSTQGIEVGANFDFDGMVTQSAPLDCLIQRIGRLDRAGQLNAGGKKVAEARIVHMTDADDFVYKGKTNATIDYLKSLKLISFPMKPRADLASERGHEIVLTEANLAQLAHTSPGNNIVVAGYIHGTTSADIAIVYRADLDAKMLEKKRADRNLFKQWFELVKPKSYELLNLPIHALHDSNSYSDVQGDEVTEKKKGKTDELTDLCVRYSDYSVVQISRVKAGELVFVPSSFGRHDNFGWNPTSTASVEDVYDRDLSDIPDEENVITRIHPAFFNSDFPFQYFFESDRYSEEFDAFIESAKECVKEEWAGKLLPRLDRFTEQTRMEPVRDSDGKVVLAVFSFRKKSKKKQPPQGLEQHSRDVEKKVREYCCALGLSEAITETLALAARWHDLGKARPEFQDMLYHPKPRGRLLLAKSGGGWGKMAPRDWRHELLSAAIVRHTELYKKAPLQKLLLHLIASHHGHSRPYAPLHSWWQEESPAFGDKYFEPFPFKFMGENIRCATNYRLVEECPIARFHMLSQKCGHYGLAFLESVLRLADQEISAL